MRNLAIFGMLSLLGLSVSCGGEDCDDGIDNDDDGLVDCEDPDCDDCPEGDTDTDTDSDTDTDPEFVDEDGDGFYSEASGGDDCDDGDANVNPGMTEECDGVDEDCSGHIDDGGVCPCDVRYYDDGATYMFCESAVTRSVAYSECAEYGYKLVSINDAPEYEWLLSYMEDTMYWIGLNDLASEGIWEWPDGTSADYLPWAEGEPSGGDQSDEDCAVVAYGHPLGDGFHDYVCEENNQHFICEAE